VALELEAERAKRGDTSSAIVRLEQLYPLPRKAIAAEIARHPDLREILWVQEEPANMGALFFVVPRLEQIAGGIPVRSVKRSASASPATSSHKAHVLEQSALLALAFATSSSAKAAPADGETAVPPSPGGSAEDDVTPPLAPERSDR
jgi:2-oxoglutarate dehydrogenase E1 component